MTAVFTATSAVCVTGLTVVDSGSYWSPFGQGVILLLMQIGGLGFMVGATVLVLVLRRRMSLRQRVILQETGSALHLGHGSDLIVRTVLFTLACEAIGAVILWRCWAPRLGLGRGLWFGVFHAVSAFTNGSFDLFGSSHSLADDRGRPLVLLTMASLIILGGLSFVLIQEVFETRRWGRLSLDSKIVLWGTAVLLLGGAAILFIIERQNPASLAGRPIGEQVLDTFFHATAARTAGFTTWDTAHSDERSLFFLLGLMFVGGAPGSMAGGIKITTAWILNASVWSTLRGHPETTALDRRIPPEQVQQALAVALLGLTLIGTVTMGISLIEGPRLHAPFLHLLFDVTSAFGTVGFSTGVTAQLSAASKLLLVLTMFIGRLGPVTFVTALTAQQRAASYRLAAETVRVG